MTYFDIFVRRNVDSGEIIDYLKDNFNAHCRKQFSCDNAEEETSCSELSVRIKELEFSVIITQFHTVSASEKAAKQIYLGSAKVQNVDSLTRLTFKCFVPYPTRELLDVVTGIASAFGGGYFTSDAYSEYIRTYVTIAPAETLEAGRTNCFTAQQKTNNGVIPDYLKGDTWAD